MAKFEHRYPLNTPGKFYVDVDCTDCDLCRECAPNNIKRDDRMGYSYVFKQPESEKEYEQVMEGVEGCPTEGVGDNGDMHNWDQDPMLDWNAIAEKWNSNARFTINNPIVAYEEYNREEDKPWWKRILRL